MDYIYGNSSNIHSIQSYVNSEDSKLSADVKIYGSGPGFIRSHHAFLQTLPTFTNKSFDSVILAESSHSEIEAALEIIKKGYTS